MLLAEPRAAIVARIARDEVLVDGVPVRKSFRLRGGATIEICPAATPVEAPPPPPPPVRYEDDDVAVVVKPAGMVVHAGAGVRSGTLVDALRAAGMTLAAGDDPRRPGIVHRLDRPTSGLLAVAKSEVALRGLRQQFDARTVGRRYRALVDGVPDPAAATIAAPIARHPHDRTRFWTAPDGRPSRSRYQVIAAFSRAAETTVELDTGRTHQIRVHMAAIGHPVCGDAVYGASEDLRLALGLDRVALHAEHLAFTHPRTQVRVVVDEPLPEDVQRARHRLRSGAV